MFRPLGKVQTSSESVDIVAPTSDVLNRSDADAVALLELGANPAAVSLSNIKAYTNYKLRLRNGQGVQPAAAVPGPWGGETPSEILSVYNFPANSGGGVIAIVDAFHYPHVQEDLAVFSTQFALPVLQKCPNQNPYTGPACLNMLSQPAAPVNCGWNGEAALDLEWVHAVAPRASVIYVEAASSSYEDLFAAVKTATAEVTKAGGGQISLSWGGGEFADEAQTDAEVFSGSVVYFASSGDVGGEVIYPAASPSVISVGGTRLLFDNSGALAAEYGWTDSGGGKSRFESLPNYQQHVENTQAGNRNIPDIAADADPKSGVAVFVSTTADMCVDHPKPNKWQPGWQVIGGTSLASPLVAAMTNVAKRHRSSVQSELLAIYANRKDVARVRDITLIDGSAGGNLALAGYDNVTGVGVPAGVNFDADPNAPH